ncbi:unnamed protein product [Rotaria magnacalcarata]|uniref:C2H2-type domain-containing protein n=3 Tax=Rotaria magnacalcarata TaxID=392030 RepID=A0A819YLX0_9BILA|nr:unnamed protein product [Rotaria magnacalcarata]CAF2119924.1 unnamed protein product [Rotaria magnacalcarata]CAF4093561.1 unnamed protein product [Rotaria magnacalcarata]CAF4155488.1 unnamed protein product [Rotaria magnacalcarata]
METPFSPPVLYLTDDDNDDDNLTEHHTLYGSSLKNTINENLPHKKRKLTNSNPQMNPSMLHWSKRQRNDNCLPQQQAARNFFGHEPETIVIDPDESIVGTEESHSFIAFDWTNDTRPAPRTYSYPIQPTPRLAIPPQNTVMNISKHHINQSDTHPLMSIIHQNDKYIPSARNKSITFPIPSTSSPPLPLPLPASTSAFTRPSIQRVPATKTIRVPYTHSTSVPPVVVHHRTEPIFSPAFHPSSSIPIINAPPTTEIRRQTINSNAVLSAFYDSKCYRCNICRFKTVTSSILLQHLFTHIFFCRQCSFYTYSQHGLYQHIFEKHSLNFHNDTIDPKTLDLLYVTRCQDGTFALCMDSSASKTTIYTSAVVANNDKPFNNSTAAAAAATTTTVNSKKPKCKPVKKKESKPKKKEHNDIVILSEKADANSQPSTSTTKHSTFIEKQAHRYVVMKHRRYFSMRHSLCLHSLTLEYKICREDAVRHICKTQGPLKRRKIKSKLKLLTFIDDIANCLKTIINDIVDIEDNRDSHGLIYKLPSNFINLIFPTADLNRITHQLKLNNRYDITTEQNEQYDSENSIFTNNQHIFLLSASETFQSEQSIITSLRTSITNSDSDVLKTPLHSLPISHDNTARFLKGTTKPLLPTRNPTSKPSSDPESNRIVVRQSSEHSNSSSTSPIIDRNNNSVISPKSKVSSIPSVIVLD